MTVSLSFDEPKLVDRPLPLWDSRVRGLATPDNMFYTPKQHMDRIEDEYNGNWNSGRQVGELPTEYLGKPYGIRFEIAEEAILKGPMTKAAESLSGAASTQVINVLDTVIGQLDEIGKAIPSQIPVPELVLDIDRVDRFKGTMKLPEDDGMETVTMCNQSFKYRPMQVDHQIGPEGRTITIKGLVT